MEKSTKTQMRLFMMVAPITGLIMIHHYSGSLRESVWTLAFATLIALPLCFLTYMSPKLEKTMSRELLSKIMAMSPFIGGIVLAIAFYMTGKTSMKVQSVVLWICILVGIVYLRQTLRKGDEKAGSTKRATEAAITDSGMAFISTGGKTYTYDSSTFYFSMIVCALIPVALLTTFYYYGDFDVVRTWTGIFYGVLIASCAPLVYVFFVSRTKFVVDSRGITQQTIFRSKKILWEEILEVKRVCISCSSGFRGCQDINANLFRYPYIDIEIKSKKKKMPILCSLNGFDAIIGKLQSMGHLKNDVHESY